MRVVRSFSFDDEKDKEIINYIDNLKNKSDYIRNLIMSDLNDKSTFTKAQKQELKNLFTEMLTDFLENNEISVDSKNEKNFDEDAIAALDQFDE